MNSLDLFEHLAETPHFSQGADLLAESGCIPLEYISILSNSILMRKFFSQKKEENFADATIVTDFCVKT